jgi:hypothetical protein
VAGHAWSNVIRLVGAVVAERTDAWVDPKQALHQPLDPHPAQAHPRPWDLTWHYTPAGCGRHQNDPYWKASQIPPRGADSHANIS